MDEALHTLVAELTNDVRTAAIPDDAKHTATWCVGQLAVLYAKYSQTSESRYADEITRMVRALLKELDKCKASRSEPQPLTVGITERFRLLHEQFGLPTLQLPVPARPPTPRSRKAS
jgi:hypothetical protein